MTSYRFANGALGAFCGGAYAAALFVMAAFAAGFGHGTYLHTEEIP